MALLTAPHRAYSGGFYRDEDLDFSARLAVGRTAYGTADIGEVLATLDRIRSSAQWFDEWSATAQEVEQRADAAAAGGHRISAAGQALRAATYWSCAVDGLLDRTAPPELLPTFRRHRRQWDRFIQLSDGAHLPVPVPYQDTELPGYLLRPDASGAPRPTLVLTNGSDGSVTDMWSCGAAGALARGWNAFVYDGPGQQSMLFERGIPFRLDWETVLTPVVDALVQRSDVDGGRLLAYGVSQAGYWLPRALAFEHRFAGAVLDPGVVEVVRSFFGHLPKSMISKFKEGDETGFNREFAWGLKMPSVKRAMTFRSRPYQQDNWFELFTTISGYRITPELAAAITTPTLIFSPEHEQFWPGQSEELAAMIGDRASIADFTARNGASWHCEPLARLQVDAVMFDWLEDRTAAGGAH